MLLSSVAMLTPTSAALTLVDTSPLLPQATPKLLGMTGGVAYTAQYGAMPHNIMSAATQLMSHMAMPLITHTAMPLTTTAPMQVTTIAAMPLTAMEAMRRPWLCLPLCQPERK